ncbi:MAG: DUF4405 domain-containing protein [Treponema sp.]|nr:DUF4405 domain-containing protein [Treponema sp.]
MTRTQRLRMTIDITMTILSIILMGGNYLFPADLVHEILGVGLFVLWVVHIILNRRWYGAIFRGKYNPYRVMQTVINCCILICTIFLMISGIILSNHVFTFLNIQSGLGFARIAHLLASHWYYLFMSVHIGLHVGRLFQNVTAKIIPRILLALACIYGLYAFIARGVWKYLILQQQFFFFDFERGYVLFALDYISIIILFATISHLIASRLKKNR